MGGAVHLRVNFEADVVERAEEAQDVHDSEGGNDGSCRLSLGTSVSSLFWGHVEATLHVKASATLLSPSECC